MGSGAHEPGVGGRPLAAAAGQERLEVSWTTESASATTVPFWRELGVLMLFLAEATVVAGGIVLAALYLT